MSRRTQKLRRAALSVLHYSGADGLLGLFRRGLGAVLMLQHVAPDKPGAFEPNRGLKVTPEFLSQTIQQVRAAGFEIVSLDEAHFRLVEGEYRHPFVCFAFDDGYRSVIEHAYPVFQSYDLPFAVYIATDYPDGHGELWWLALERAIVKVGALDVKIDGAPRRFKCATPLEKERTFQSVYQWLRSIDEDDARMFVRDLCGGIGISLGSLSREMMMSWGLIRELASDPRVTIGSHTRRHYALAGLTLAKARAEIEESLSRIEREVGQVCRHFSYPYGDEASAGAREFDLVRELGLRTGVTARQGLMQPQHSCALTSLPSVALSGEVHNPRYVKVLLSGVPFAFSAAS
jgi:peptidoglycan/xylan/chitin deacetylase (PgdA/CDA1 family)